MVKLTTLAAILLTIGCASAAPFGVKTPEKVYSNFGVTCEKFEPKTFKSDVGTVVEVTICWDRENPPRLAGARLLQSSSVK